ncbi:MAG: P22 phage major capsid protein family protein, partial [Pseudaminobacter sp.]
MANVLLTPTAVTREALRILHQKLNFIGNVNRTYDDSFAKDGAKIGDSLKIRLPNQYVVRTGPTLATQETKESSVTLQVATQKGVDLNFTSTDLTLSLDDFSTRILKPAMSVLAANIESDMLVNVYKDVYQQVNNAGSAITFKRVLEGKKKLVDSLTPPDLNLLLNTQDNIDLVDALKGLFQDSKEIAKQYRDGMVGRTGGFDIWENTMMPSHLRGGANDSYVCNTSSGITSGTATI